MVPVIKFCKLLFFVNFIPEFLNYLIGISINLVKFLFLSRALHIVEELGGGAVLLESDKRSLS